MASIYGNLFGTKESIYIRKEFNSHRIGLGHQHGRRFIVLGWPPWRHVKTLYRGIKKGFSRWDNRKMKNDPIVPIHPRSICTLLLTRPHDLYWKWAGTYCSEVSRGVLFWILGGGLPPGSSNSDPTSHGARKIIFLQRFQAWLLTVIIGLQNL